jgi:ketosteroid isomerase-like protein
MPGESPHVATARRYLASIEDGTLAATYSAFFTPDFAQEEFPNRLTPGGARRDLAAVREAAERGKQVVTSQRYQVLNSVASGETVALEVQWSATLAVPVGTLPAGGEMRARFAVFLEFRDGKIARQRNYDCFDPF